MADRAALDAGPGIDLIVLADASGRSMAFGPGLVAGTAPPGTPGNTVLSGHRDTQFRFLRSLAPGDRLRLEDARGAWHDYAVSDALVVDAQAVEILWDTDDSLLTLVTCYPFDALVPGGPLRYVVRATALSAGRAANAGRGAQPDPGDRSASGPAVGPVPDSSCLKYTNASRHSGRAATAAHRASSAGPYLRSRRRRYPKSAVGTTGVVPASVSATQRAALRERSRLYTSSSSHDA